MDLLAIVRAIQAVSSEVVLDTILEKMLGILIDASGAQHGALLMPVDGALTVRAMGQISHSQSAAPAGDPDAEGAARIGKLTVTVTPDGLDPEEACAPDAVSAAVAATGQIRLYGDVRDHPDVLAADPWLVEIGVRSLVCIPIQRHQAVVGVVCLGHCDRADAFDDDMVELLDLLSAQLAVSLENVGLFDDLWNEVTERKRVEDSLRQLNEHLERRVEERTRELEVAVAALARSNSELEQFAYAASHDLQEPLRVISGFSGLLKTQCGERLDDTGRMYVSHMSEAADRMRRLVADLLGYSRLTSRIAPPSPVEPSEVLAEVRVNLQAAFEESGASLTHDELPVVMADRAQFLRLLQNLVGNAVKYRGEDQPWVHVSGRQQGDEWIFGVADNGIGIPKAQQSSVFDIFRRLHRTDEYPGTGIGLASVKKIVECQGGRVWVESQEGAGSTFWFTWPVQSPDQPVLTGRDPRSSAPTLDLPANG